MSNTGNKGWFTIPGVQEGERTLAEGVAGLELISHNMQGQTVLDLGCAEGLVGHWCLERGAASVHGFEGSPHLLATGRKLMKRLGEDRLNLSLWNFNSEINIPTPFPQYDIVLALSIVHKLKDPQRFLLTCKRLAKRWLVIRAPVPDIKIKDGESDDWYRLDIRSFLRAWHADDQFNMVAATAEAMVPWVATFQRKDT